MTPVTRGEKNRRRDLDNERMNGSNKDKMDGNDTHSAFIFANE